MRLSRRPESAGPEPLTEGELLGVRGVVGDPGAAYQLKDLLPPDNLRGVTQAAARLARAIGLQETILIIGDYDADGATSCALMVEGLGLLGASDVRYLIPNRFDLGYGLSPKLVDLALVENPALIVTVDQGIVSVDGVRHAKAKGLDVIVTDHHLPGEQLPLADAIVNPNQPDCHFESKNLAGVGVAFYLLIALRQALAADNVLPETGARLVSLLDLVALGTVADLVGLDPNNRRLVQAGIRQIRSGRARPGIKALIEVAGLDDRVLTTQQIAFNIAPRLNAAGRLDDMSLGVECLLAPVHSAVEQAQTLDALNQERRRIEKEMGQQALEWLPDLAAESVENLFSVCLFDPRWHEGVIGVLAARVRAQCARPVFIFTEVDGALLKGSGRSIDGLHLRDLLVEVDRDCQGLLQKFGGHAMAAGVTIQKRDFEMFRDRLNEFAGVQLKGRSLDETVVSDGLPLAFDLVTVGGLVRDHPWGQGFPAPVFDERLEVLEQKLLAGGHLRLKLLSPRFDQVLEGIFFNRDRMIESRSAHFVFKLDVNRFRGVDRPQLVITHCL
ncbi:MAG: single-stranded-DNA-specific exonuclease RecJ [Pseudomonadales bacterium]|nr:single-stranded-DNA-specific exonuclease RecJ [Pseudomonadales bacterium]